MSTLKHSAHIDTSHTVVYNDYMKHGLVRIVSGEGGRFESR